MEVSAHINRCSSEKTITERAFSQTNNSAIKTSKHVEGQLDFWN